MVPAWIRKFGIANETQHFALDKDRLNLLILPRDFMEMKCEAGDF